MSEAHSLTHQWKQGIPIEVVPFAYAKVLRDLAELGSPAVLADGKPGLSLRMGKMKAGPVVSDNGNFIIDAPFPENMMKNPADVSAARHTFLDDTDA
jgi:ribose 5-phosphate isomerase A